MPAPRSARQLRREEAEREWSVVRPGDEPFATRTPPKLSEAIPDVLRIIGLDDRWRQNQVAEAWSEVVGAPIARHARPVAFRKQTLIVGVDHSAWLRELTHLKPQILEKLRTRFGADAPRELLLRIQ